MNKPRISVLLATADRPALLDDCLRNLGATRYGAAEVLVLDQSRVANGAPRRQGENGGPAIRYFRCPRRGKSAALNLGVQQARGELLAFTDDDCTVAPDWLEIIDQAAREEGEGCALTGKVLPGAREDEAVVAPSLRYDEEEQVFRAPSFRDVLFGNNMAIPAQLLDRAGRFDELLGPGTQTRAAEDNDLGYRLLCAGIAIRYLPSMVVTHRSWRPEDEQVELFHGYGIGQGAFYGKHARNGDRHMMARMARNIWDAGRDLGGALLLGRTCDVKVSSAFATGLIRGFLKTTLAPPYFHRNGGKGIGAEKRP